MPVPSPWQSGTQEDKSAKEKAQSLIKSFGAMYYAEARAVQGYKEDARKWAQASLNDLKESGEDPEEMQDTIEPLQEIIDNPSFGRAQVQARLNDAEWDLIDWAPGMIAALMR